MNRADCEKGNNRAPHANNKTESASKTQDTVMDRTNNTVEGTETSEDKSKMGATDEAILLERIDTIYTVEQKKALKP